MYLFASPQNAQEERFITEKENAFSFDWGILAQEKPVWIYPPMSILEKTLTKLGLDRAMGVLVYLEDALTLSIQGLLHQMVLWDIPIPSVKHGIQPNPPWLMHIALLDGMGCDPSTLDMDLVVEINQENEGTGWKGCKRRSTRS